MRINKEENWKSQAQAKCENWNSGLFSEYVLTVVIGSKVFIGNWMRGWSECLTFGLTYSLSPVTPPRGALQPMTSLRPQHLYSLNSVWLIISSKGCTFKPFWGFNIFDFLSYASIAAWIFGIVVTKSQNILICWKVLTWLLVTKMYCGPLKAHMPESTNTNTWLLMSPTEKKDWEV